ncbi:hypothetical protein [Streptomyces pseudovenezuelae]|uniref:hypothetical protein n=1 Tax=Streptomyces pseudovenezuelae TaxID=67350 RepID=UPI002E81BC28|nr:hypothetical protein [Streptomyces pseudovenezuelae]WUA94477.1 hypothetical protein OHO81_44695 [Streptomyces pseudovenezuelae]
MTRNAPGGLRFGMFAVCVIRDGSPDLAGKPKELYTVLVTFSDVQARDTDKGYPYRTALAKAMGCSTKTVDRATAALEKMGLVTTHRRKLPGSSENDANRYELHDGWLIQGMEPGPDVPPQLVARYGHLIPGFDVEAFLGGGDTSVATPGDMGVATGGDMGVAQSRDLLQEPSSRTNVPDGRRPSTGSRGRASGGFAASGKTNPPPLTREQHQQAAGFFQALPKELADLVPANPPSNLKAAVLEALAAGRPQERTAQQLVDFRLLPKWNKHYASTDAAGPIERPVGVLIAMLRRDAECGDARCDERTNVDTGQPCRACEVRGVDKRAERAAEEPVRPLGRPVATAPPRAPVRRLAGPVPPPREAPMTEVSDQQRVLARQALLNRTRTPR